METGQQIQQNETVNIQKFSSLSLVGRETITVYSNVLTVREVRSGTYSKVCRADVAFRDLIDGEQVTRYPGVATAHQMIVVRGESMVTQSE